MRLLKTVLLFLLCATIARADEAPSAKTELAAAITVLKAHHMNSAKLDWPAVETRAQAMLGDKTQATDAYPAIYYVIRQLGEKHTNLMTADAAKAAATGKPVGIGRDSDIRTPEGYALVGGIGLITLKRHQGSPADDLAYATAARDALATFARAHICRYIVDLRGNGGGNMYPMIAGLETLLGREPYGYWQDVGAPERPWRLADVNDVGQPGTDGRQRDLQSAAPVAVLLDRETASAGEDTAIAFEGREGARFFGEPSGGYLTANKAYSLPDGAILAVSVGWSTDRLHRSYHETITPDEATPRGQGTLDAAIAWLKKQPCREAP